MRTALLISIGFIFICVYSCSVEDCATIEIENVHNDTIIISLGGYYDTIPPFEKTSINGDAGGSVRLVYAYACGSTICSDDTLLEFPTQCATTKFIAN